MYVCMYLFIYLLLFVSFFAQCISTIWIGLGLLIFFYVFEMYFMKSLLCSPRLHLFDKKYSKNSNIVKWY